MSRSLRVDQVHIGTVKAAVRARFHTQRELSEESRVALATVSNFLNGRPVDRAIFEELCTKLSLHWKEIAAPPEEPAPQPATPVTSTIDRPITRQDWGEAPEVSTFYGRMDELSTLEQWITHDRCRLIAILGMGGMGKTTLAVKLAEQVQDEFEYVIWRSLLNAPPIDEILTDWIKFLSNQQETQLPTSINGQFARLRYYLQTHRCLLILDNAETILSGGTLTGQYRSGYEAYGQLFEQLGKTVHQSCLLITSREKPREIARLEAGTRPVRSLGLTGLEILEGKQIFAELGHFTGSDSDWIQLVQHYNGNPLGLELAAKFINEFFAGEIQQFLRLGKLVFLDLSELLDRHFKRLSNEEQEVVFWLAINREPASISELEEDILNPNVKQQIASILQSLNRRWALEQVGNSFTLQPVLMEFITDQFVAQVVEEISSGTLSLFNRHALLKAVAKEYVREAQHRLIVRPVVDLAVARLGNQTALEAQLQRIVVMLRSVSMPGYAAGNILNLLCSMQTTLQQFDFSHLTIWQAYLQGTTLHDVNFTHAHFAKSVFTQTFGGVLSVAFSPDGKTMATGNANGNIYLWRVEDGQHLLICRGHTNWVRSVLFSPDAQILVSASEDQTIKIWDLQDGACLRTIRGHTLNLRSIAFSPDGRFLASASDDQTIRLWNVLTGECLNTFKGHNHWVLSVTFSPNGKYIASGSCDQTIRLWDIKEGTCLRIFEGHISWVVPICFSPDGQQIVSSGFDQTVRVWNVNNGKCLHVLQEHSGWLWAATFSPDGQRIASAGVDQTIRIWETKTGQCLLAIQAHTKQIWSVAFHPDGQRLASCGDDQTIRIWNIEDGRCLSVIKGYANWVKSVTFGKDDQTLISANQDHTVRVWDIRTQQCLDTLNGHTNSVISVAYTPNGQRFASGSDDRTIRIWNADHTCLYTLKEHLDAVWSVQFSPNGQTLASAGCDCTIKLWDIQDGVCLHTLKGHTDRILSIAFNADGSLIASASEDQTIKIWNVITGQCLLTIQETARVMSIAFSPLNPILASGSLDTTIKLWNVQDGSHLQTLQGHTGWVMSLAFSPDGQILASGSCDHTVKLWRSTDGICINTLKQHTNWVWSVSFSHDGQRLASASEDEIIRVWKVKTGKCLAELKTKSPYEGMNIAKTTGLTSAQKSTLKALGAVEAIVDKTIQSVFPQERTHARSLSMTQDCNN